MPVLRGPITDHGAVVEVTVGPSQLARESVGVDDLPHATIKVLAMFDTGADSTLIHTGLPERIGIVPHGTISLLGVHGKEVECPVFDVDVDFGQDITMHNISVVEATIRSLSDGIDLLIGRSALWRGRFTYHGLAPDPYFEFEL